MARTRSAAAHDKVLEATLALFVERGIGATSMDSVAEASGVSKATIYKHWADKDALALEALCSVFGLYEQPPKFDSGNLRQDFIDVLTYQPAKEHQEMKNRIMPHVMAYAAQNREFGEKWRTRMIELPQARLTKLLQRGMAEKKLDRMDPKAGIALLFGPMLYHHIFVNRKQITSRAKKSSDALAARVVDTFWKAYGKT
jgi:AcrR family transcriptional regulator